jgi:hypothetical protein
MIGGNGIPGDDLGIEMQTTETRHQCRSLETLKYAEDMNTPEMQMTQNKTNTG